MQGERGDRTNEQSAKNERMPAAVKKELLSLRHRFGERTSCEGRLTTQFRLVNSGKILSRDGRRQMSTPYYYRAWTAFPHFLIRFTRAIQRNEKGWDALFLYALAAVKAKWKTNEYNEEKIPTNWALVWKMTIFASELREKSWLGKKGILSSKQWNRQ